MHVWVRDRNEPAESQSAQNKRNGRAWKVCTRPHRNAKKESLSRRACSKEPEAAWSNGANGLASSLQGAFPRRCASSTVCCPGVTPQRSPSARRSILQAAQSPLASALSTESAKGTEFRIHAPYGSPCLHHGIITKKTFSTSHLKPSFVYSGWSEPSQEAGTPNLDVSP